MSCGAGQYMSGGRCVSGGYKRGGRVRRQTGGHLHGHTHYLGHGDGWHSHRLPNGQWVGEASTPSGQMPSTGYSNEMHIAANNNMQPSYPGGPSIPTFPDAYGTHAHGSSTPRPIRNRRRYQKGGQCKGCR